MLPSGADEDKREFTEQKQRLVASRVLARIGDEIVRHRFSFSEQVKLEDQQQDDDEHNDGADSGVRRLSV